MMLENELLQYLLQYPLLVLPMFFLFKEMKEKSKEREKNESMSKSLLNAYLENAKIVAETRQIMRQNTEATTESTKLISTLATKLDFIFREKK